jgi:hypothetical protein
MDKRQFRDWRKNNLGIKGFRNSGIEGILSF